MKTWTNARAILDGPVAAVSLLAGAALVTWVGWLGHPDYPLDDAYIVQHSVAGLLEGGETRFIGSSPLQGVTSPVHVALIFGLSHLLPVPWAQLLVVCAAAVSFACGALVFALREGLKPVSAIAIVLVACGSGLVPYQLLNGLETGLALSAVMWALVLFREPQPARAWHHALLGLLPFIRPELGALSALLLGREFLSISRTRAGARPALDAIAWSAVGAALPITFLLAFGGSLIPNTMSAKAYFFADGCAPLLDRMALLPRLLTGVLVFLGVVSLGLMGLVRARLRWIAFGFIVIFFIAFLTKLPGALTHNYFRYPTILVPFFIVGWVALVAGSELGTIRQIKAALLAAGVVVLGFTLPTTWRIYSEAIDGSRTENAGVASWAAQNIPADATVLIHDAGYISLLGSQPLVDLVGLKTPASVPINREFIWQTCSRNPAAISQIASQFEADYVVVLQEWDNLFGLTAGFAATGWDLQRVDGERGESAYKVYSLRRSAFSSSSP